MFRHYSSRYNIVVDNPQGVMGVLPITLDGAPLSSGGTVIPLANDGTADHVHVILGSEVFLVLQEKREKGGLWRNNFVSWRAPWCWLVIAVTTCYGAGRCLVYFVYYSRLIRGKQSPGSPLTSSGAFVFFGGHRGDKVICRESCLYGDDC
jgi:hypothetical protein